MIHCNIDQLTNSMLASFCKGRQLTVNPSKTKFVIFGARKSDCKDFVFSGTCCTTVERHDEYRYIFWLCVL